MIKKICPQVGQLRKIAAMLMIGPSVIAMSTSASSADPLNVVTSITILADMVEQIGGDAVSVQSLVGPNSDAHVFEPSPSHVQSVAAADVLIINGLTYEGWMDRLVDASGYDGPVVVATMAINAIDGQNDDDGHDEHGDGDHDHDDHGHDDHGHDDHGHDDHGHDDHGHDDHGHGDQGHDDHGHDDHGHDHGSQDPHAWQSLTEARSYASTIADALMAADPDNAVHYDERLADFDQRLADTHAWIRELMGSLPEDNRTIVVPHAAFEYFARDYGITFLSPSGLTTEAEPTAAQMAGLVDLIADQGVAAIFAESVSSPRMVQLLATEAGIELGGTLYSDALTGPDGDAPTYIDMMRHNASVIHAAIVD